MNLGPFDAKDPNSTLDYQVNVAPWLATGDTISAHTVTVPAGLTKVSDNHTATAINMRLSGGTDGQDYQIVVTWTTSSGQVDEGVATLPVRNDTDVAYVTIAEVRATAQAMTSNAVPPANDTLVRDLIERASRMFDRECAVIDGYFNAFVGPDPSNKIIYGDGSNFLRLPPYIDGSLNQTITMPTGYTVPTFVEANGYLVVSSSTGVLAPIFPWAYSAYSAWSTSSSGWPRGVPVTVTAKWGFAKTPADVKAAIIEWVINLWREIDPATAKLVGMEGATLREDIPPRVARQIKFWKMKVSPAFV